MKKIFCTVFLLGMINMATAQIDNPNASSVQFESTTTDVNNPTGYELPAIKTPSLTNSNNKFTPKDAPKLGDSKDEQFDMSEDDKFISSKSNKGPKYFTKDKEAKEEYGRDQDLGDIKTGASYVNVVYRDHEYVDGDRIRVFVNDDVVQSDISLDGTFRGFDLPLQQGVNRIDFQALNQGSSGPNTAELHVYDDNGVLVSAKEWNLLTGHKASILVIKE